MKQEDSGGCLPDLDRQREKMESESGRQTKQEVGKESGRERERDLDCQGEKMESESGRKARFREGKGEGGGGGGERGREEEGHGGLKM